MPAPGQYLHFLDGRPRLILGLRLPVAAPGRFALGAAAGIVLAVACGVVAFGCGALTGVAFLELMTGGHVSHRGQDAVEMARAMDLAPWVALAGGVLGAACASAMLGALIVDRGARRSVAVMAIAIAAAVGTSGSPTLGHGDQLLAGLAASALAASVAGAVLFGAPPPEEPREG